MTSTEKILHKLKHYIKNTPREEVLKSWGQIKEKAPKCGPNVKEFIEQNKNNIKPKIK